MRKVYSNFDGLDVSFQCALPQTILNQLETAKNEAILSRKLSFIELGPNNMKVAVADSGMKGGYTFRFDTGLDGQTWGIKNNTNTDEWNVRVSCKSLCLALHGYFKTKRIILGILDNALQAKGPSEFNKRTGHTSHAPKERVSRFDYCVDFRGANFSPNPNRMIAHNRCKVNYHSNGGELPVEVMEQGRKIQSIRAGKMPNRQAALYDKTAEIIATSKSYWWDIWAIDKMKNSGKVWRVEARAGKAELNKWNLRTFEDFEAKAGDVIISILKAIRYVKQNRSDKNASRWEMTAFWQDAIMDAETCLVDFISNADRKQIIRDYRSAILSRYKTQIAGNITGYSAALGRDVSELPGVLEVLSDEVIDMARHSPENYRKKHRRAVERFEFIGEEE